MSSPRLPATARPASSPLHVSGVLRVPGDKSISHRALMLAALGSGTSRITGLLDSADVRSTASVLRGLGIRMPAVGAEMIVAGVGLRGLRPAAAPLDCGNSGTTARLLAGIVAGAGVGATFVGDASLTRRPMQRVARPLEALGARIRLAEGGGLPMAVAAVPLHGGEVWSEAASAQVRSAVLLAALVAGVSATVHEPAPSRDHTERMLAARGVPLELLADGVAIVPLPELPPLDVDVPGDPSSAAFFAALAALASGGELCLTGVCLNPRRTGFLRVLRRMGAQVRTEARDVGGEPVGSITVRPGDLVATDVGAADVPSMVDELPLVACLAARAAGVTTISGASELRVKESDRIAAVVGNLQALGVDAEELPDGMRVVGSSARLAGMVRTFNDHRLAMAFGVLAALPGSRIELDHAACVDVSYPGFWQDLARVTA